MSLPSLSISSYFIDVNLSWAFVDMFVAAAFAVSLVAMVALDSLVGIALAGFIDADIDTVFEDLTYWERLNFV